MPAWPRLLATLVPAALSGLVAGGLIAATVTPAFAQSARDQAERLNDEGKVFLTSTPMQPADAADRFQKAIELVQDGRYFANLCLALYHVGKLGEALTACRAVATHGGDERAVKQAENLMEKAIKPKMREAGIDPDAPPPPPPDAGTGGTGGTDGTGGTGDPDGGTGGTGGTGTPADASNFTVAPPPSLLEQKAAPTHAYTWTLGAQLLGASVAIGYPEAYDSGGVGLRVTGDYMIMPRRGVGLIGFVQAMQIDKRLQGQALSVVDVGVGIYKDFCMSRLCLRPAASAGLSLFQTQVMAEAGSDSLVGLSARLDGTAGYAFGARYEHLITATIGAAAYTAPVGDYENEPADYGLDEGGSTVYFGIGYTHRFDTPFGSSPFFVVQ